MPFKNSMEEKMQICHFQNSQKGNKCPIFKLVIDPGSYFQVLELLLKVLFGTNHRGSGSVDQPKMSYKKSSIAMDFICSQCCSQGESKKSWQSLIIKIESSRS